MDTNELLSKLDRIEEAMNAKGHPMQDFSSLKMALFDIVDVVREMVKCCDNEKCCSGKE